MLPGVAENRPKWGNWGNLSVELDQERFLNGFKRRVEEVGTPKVVNEIRNAPGREEEEM